MGRYLMRLFVLVLPHVGHLKHCNVARIVGRITGPPWVPLMLDHMHWLKHDCCAWLGAQPKE